jgi:hypothetical protein
MTVTRNALSVVSGYPFQWQALSPSMLSEAARMTNGTFSHHRDAALALLSGFSDLPHKTAGFLGHLCVASEPTTRQRSWLNSILKQKGFQPLNTGGAE